jgi:hypothetical protein
MEEASKKSVDVKKDKEEGAESSSSLSDEDHPEALSKR